MLLPPTRLTTVGTSQPSISSSKTESAAPHFHFLRAAAALLLAGVVLTALRHPAWRASPSASSKHLAAASLQPTRTGRAPRVPRKTVRVEVMKALLPPWLSLPDELLREIVDTPTDDHRGKLAGHTFNLDTQTIGRDMAENFASLDEMQLSLEWFGKQVGTKGFPFDQRHFRMDAQEATLMNFGADLHRDGALTPEQGTTLRALLQQLSVARASGALAYQRTLDELIRLVDAM